MTISELRLEFERELPSSSAADRKALASRILEEGIDPKELCVLLHREKKIALPFLWFLSELGLLAPNALSDLLPHLYSLRNKIEHVDLRAQFPTYWLIAGVPKEQEGVAVDLLLDLLLLPETNKTNKARAMKVWNELKERHPDLQREWDLKRSVRTFQ